MMLKFLYCTLIKKKHDYAVVTGTYLHKRGLKKLPADFSYEFCLRCHNVNIIKREEENLLERARKKII